jgi:hypothetical protein
MTTSKVPTYLRRYTDLPALLHMLSSRTITLLDPKTWDDRNDAFYMSQYKDRKNLKTLLALCFSQVPETYHHWHVFSKGPAGVCIVFDRAALLESFFRQEGVSADTVEYMTLIEAKKYTFEINRLPFLKRAGFKPEGEFRVIYTSASDERPSISIPMELSCIRSISLSPWLHASFTESAVRSIRAIDGCAKLKVSRSTLISNEQWKTLGKNAS